MECSERPAQPLRGLVASEPIQVAQDKRGVQSHRQAGEFRVEKGPQFAPFHFGKRVRGVGRFCRKRCVLIPTPPALRRAYGDAMKPPGQAFRHSPTLPHQCQECCLEGVVRVGGWPEYAATDAKYHRSVSLYEHTKRVRVATGGIAFEQLRIGDVAFRRSHLADVSHHHTRCLSIHSRLPYSYCACRRAISARKV